MSEHPSIKKIALLGMDKRSATIVKQLLEQTSPPFCEIVDISSAEMGLIDIDGANHHNDLELLQNKYSQLPVVAISIKSQEVEGMYFLRKPLSLTKFSELVRHISTRAYTQKAVGDGVSIVETNYRSKPVRAEKTLTAIVANGLMDRAKIKLNNSGAYTECDDVFFDPANFTLSYVLKAIEKSKKSKKQIVVKTWDDKTILIDTKHGKILTDISTAQMRTLGVVVVDNKNSKVNIKTADPKLEFDFNPRFNSSIRVSTIDEFVWRLAYITARGRLPKYLANDVVFNLQTPVYINEWPNFTRMEAIPHAISTVAFWIQQPITIGKLSSLLNVSDKDINSLFFACFSLGIAGQGTRQVQAAAIIEMNHVEKHKHRGIFSAILDHLKGKE